MPGPAGPFSREERIWIVFKFGEVKSATLVRRAFQKKFPSPNPKDVPHRKVLARVLEKFEGCGDVGDPKPKFKPAEILDRFGLKKQWTNMFTDLCWRIWYGLY